LRKSDHLILPLWKRSRKMACRERETTSVPANGWFKPFIFHNQKSNTSSSKKFKIHSVINGCSNLKCIGCVIFTQFNSSIDVIDTKIGTEIRQSKIELKTLHWIAGWGFCILKSKPIDIQHTWSWLCCRSETRTTWNMFTYILLVRDIYKHALQNLLDLSMDLLTGNWKAQYWVIQMDSPTEAEQVRHLEMRLGVLKGFHWEHLCI